MPRHPATMADNRVEIVSFSMPEAVRALPVRLPSTHSRATAPSDPRVPGRCQLPNPFFGRGPLTTARPPDGAARAQRRAGNGSASPSQLPSSRHPFSPGDRGNSFAHTHVADLEWHRSLPPRVGPASGAAFHRALRPCRWKVGHSRRALLYPSPGAPALGASALEEACSSLISTLLSSHTL